MKAVNSPGFVAGDWLIISGQTGRQGANLVSPEFAAQFKQCLANLGAILQDANLPVEAVAKVNIYLRRMADRDAMNALYTAFFGDHLPARTTVVVSELARDALVEVEAWAYRKQLATVSQD
jgi:2-iminobutanoate/2-iminopropanoate deaminase